MTGLVRAIERFDFNKYAEFSVYATYWIHQRIVRELYNNMGQFRIPIYKLQQLLKKSANSNDLLSINYFGIDQIHDEDVNLYILPFLDMLPHSQFSRCCLSLGQLNHHTFGC